MAGAAAAPVKSGVSLYPCLCSTSKRRQLKKLDLSSSFLDATRLSLKMRGSRRRQRPKGLVIVDELGGQYEDTFNDVKKQIINFFTEKAVRTVLEQLYEMNPPQYQWFNNFVTDNEPKKAVQFLQTLVKERQDLAERVMITRLTLYSRWIKKGDHDELYNEMSEENLKMMRERLMETIIWPSDDNTKPGQKTDS